MRAAAGFAVVLAIALAAWLWWARPVEVRPTASAMDAPATTIPGDDDPQKPDPQAGDPPRGDAPAAGILPPPVPTRTAMDAPPAATAPSAASTDATAALLVPVQGVGREALHDTFSDARGAGRPHDAIDIMAPAGTPVLAVADGHVEKLFDSERGGLTLYQFEPGGRYAYYYAHLQGYAPGIEEGRALRRGETIGYVGSTGNADPAAPHLHFAIFRLGPERRWWEGEAINPYPYLRDGTALP
ncbi:M23 family metallopeptidase [Luteimonas huabeiensis]|uniref:M23 family metallopeptidase n=1 Tax=Luteimonas huabeiensis TaxID=1244513 RepID=UPI0004656A57|nr:M23 family metallopeptidase [Luteimonas huabeiensis]